MSEHPFLRGMGMGMMAGAAMGAIMMKKEKDVKRAAKHTVKSMGRLAEDAADMVADKLPK